MVVSRHAYYNGYKLTIGRNNGDYKEQGSFCG